MNLIAVEYRELVPGLLHFDCSRLHACLSSKACAERHARAVASRAYGERASCLSCPIGARHAGGFGLRTTAHPLPGSTVVAPDSGNSCVRCGIAATRLVRQALCVSCYNREREFIKGRNAKGTAPATYRPLLPRRVGVVIGDRNSYRTVLSQNAAEAIAFTRRAGNQMHSEPPGRTHWNADRQAFEYRNDNDQVLLDLEIDGEIHFFAVASVRDAEEPAKVTMPTLAASAGWLREWLEMSGEVETLAEDDWRAQPMICEDCGYAPLQARRRAGRAQCRCLACGAFA